MRIKTLTAAILAAICLCVPAQAKGDFAGELEPFLQEHGLGTHNFSLCYYNTVTGEEVRYNADKMMVAASTYKLPLNLYYYEMEAAGEIASDAVIPNSGTTLDVCHQKSIVDSNNEVSIAMLYHLGNFRTYKEKMSKYFSATGEELPYLYFVDNYYSTGMMLDTLKYLYENQAQFPELLEYMTQACSGAYFQKYVTDCQVAHKYGSFEGAENDVAIIFAQQPFLLAVYTQDVGQEICSLAAKLAKEYTDGQTPPPQPDPLPEPVPESQPQTEPPVTEMPEQTEQAEQSGTAFPVWILPMISAVCISLACILLAIQKRSKVKQ